MRKATSTPIKKLHGKARVPGDKSISHRALILASQALGTTRISGLLEGEDVLHTAAALQALGVSVRNHAAGAWEVRGVGIGGLHEPTQVLDMGNAGTGARLMMGLLAPYPFVSVFTGDASLCGRPMGRVIAPLSEIGAQFTARQEKFLPLAMKGTAMPMPITYRLPVASAQVKSAVLLAGLNTPGITTVIEPQRTRDHTERMLRHFGIAVEFTDKNKEHIVTLRGQQETPFKERTLSIPADPSSAAFPLVAALIAEDGDVTLPDVCINPLRTGLLDTLKEMGADITLLKEREEAGEPVADIRAKASALKGVTVPASRAPSMIDEYPILAVAASFAKGDTVMHGLSELRVKESDRLSAIVAGLAACGVKATIDGDTLTVHGAGKKPKGGGNVTTHYDHRIAMSFLVMGTATEKPVTVDDARAIATSFPGFVELLTSLGAAIEVEAPKTPKRRAVDKRKAVRRVIAIDGPAASGKGTLARKLARHYGYASLDTGSLYRAVGLKLLDAGQDPHDATAATHAAEHLSDDDLADPRLRQEDVGNAASVVSAIPGVRDALLEYQRHFATRPEGAILDGRDIGTVVCPDADVKLFLTASLDARAKRRHEELQAQGIEVVYQSVLDDLKERDARDSQRKAAPLVPAQDAIPLDTTPLTAQAVFDKAVKIIDGM